MKPFFDFFNNNDNIRTMTSVLAFILSLSNTIYLVFTQRFKIKVRFKEYVFINKIKDKPLILGMVIENPSRLPVSVSRMFLHVNKQKFEFSWFPQIIFESNLKQKENIIDKSNIYSLCFPQNINSLGSCCGYFALCSDNKFDINDIKQAKCKIEIHSNRGKRKFKIDFSFLDYGLSR